MLKKPVHFLFTLLALAFTACNPTRNVPQGSYLLDKYEIIPDSNVLAKEKFESLMRQKPNRKLVGFIRFHLWLYNKGKSGKDSKFKTGLRNIGEEPVILDSVAIDQTKDQFKLFLNKNGFFNGVISDSVRYTTNKKATVEYYIKYNQYYKIKSINYSTQDTGITKLIYNFQFNSLIKPGERYSEDVLDQERERITNA